MIPVRILQAPSKERGIALVAAMLVVLLSAVLVATFMVTTTGERTMSSNVQIAKASLYAADAGVRTQQQDLANRLNAKVDSAVTAYTGVGLVISNPQNLFPTGSYTVTCTNPPFTANGRIYYAGRDSTASSQSFDYGFVIQSQGSSGLAGTRRIQSQGILRVSATRQNFTNYLIYTNTHQMADGSSVYFSSNTNFDGAVHTNTMFRFAFKPTFNDIVTSVSDVAVYNNNGHPVTLNANNNGNIDKPFFYGGFQRDVSEVPLPTNVFSQQNAALQGNPGITTAPSNATINTYCTTGVSGSSTPPNGIYVSHDGSGNALGFYIKGTLTSCKLWADTTNGKQYYQMVQSSTTKTICVDVTTTPQTIKVWNSASTAGTPAETYTKGTQMTGVMYVDGGINDLRGPDRVSGTPPPALAVNQQLLITAKNDVVIQRDITVDNYDDNTNVLGIMSGQGSVRIGSGAPNECNLDAFVMAIGTDGEFTVDSFDSGSYRGMFHLRGGMVAQYYGAFGQFNSSNGTYLSGFGRDFKYDRRGLTPPCYPTLTTFTHSLPIARTLSWKEI